MTGLLVYEIRKINYVDWDARSDWDATPIGSSVLVHMYFCTWWRAPLGMIRFRLWMCRLYISHCSADSSRLIRRLLLQDRTSEDRAKTKRKRKIKGEDNHELSCQGSCTSPADLVAVIKAVAIDGQTHIVVIGRTAKPPVVSND